MKQVTVKDKKFNIFITESELVTAISELGKKMSKDLDGKKPLFIAILNGAFMFAAELLKNIETDCEVSFVKYASYHQMASTGQVQTLIGSNEAVTGRTVVILEDIIDTGITMEKVVSDIKAFEPAEIKIATMLFKPGAFQKDYPIDYVALEIPNDFIVGYGLDYDGYGRNLKDIYKVV